MKIIIGGALGHMGREVAAQAAAMGLEIAAGVDIADATADFPIYHSFTDMPAIDAVIVDFSSPACLDDLLAYASRNHVPAVLCTTGYTEEQLVRIDRASEHAALFRSANMSIGIALLRVLCRKAAEVLGEAYDVEIVETHHNRKKDAPSGTALILYDAIKGAYEEQRVAQNGRSGRDCKRAHNEIGIHALRGGTVTGEHEVCFFGNSERIRITHSAENRGLFASGALRAAQWMYGKAPGMYSMEDVVSV